MKNTILTTTVLTIAVFTVGVFITEAQAEVRVESETRTEMQSDADTGEGDEQDERANYNNSRSNRATIRGESAGDADEDAQRAQDYNSSRSNKQRAETGGDTDSDGDGISDVEEEDAELESAPAQDYNAARSNKPTGEREITDPDSDGDGLDDGSERANYNNTRSNRANVVGPDTDVCDGVTCTDGSCAATADECSAVQAQSKEIDKASPKLYDTLSIEEDSPLRSAGVEISTRTDVCVSDEDCDDDDPSVSPVQAVAFRISGEEVRGWSAEKKEAVRTRLEIMGETNPASDFGMRVAAAALDDEDVVDISSDKDATEVRHKTRLRLFGLVSLNSIAVTRADAAGETSVSYPWWALFTRKADSDKNLSLATELRVAHNAMLTDE